MTATRVEGELTPMEFFCGDDTPLSHMCALVLELAPAGSGQADAAAGCNAHWNAVRDRMADLERDLSASTAREKALQEKVEGLEREIVRLNAAYKHLRIVSP